MVNKLNKIQLYLLKNLKNCPIDSLTKYLSDFISDFKQELKELNEEGKSEHTNKLIVKLFYEKHLIIHSYYEQNKNYEGMANYFNTLLYHKNCNPFIVDYQKIPFDLTITKINNHIDEESKSGCYIATMAYGGYDHPQVIELQKFRDDFLSKSIIGRSFVKFYYKYSPLFVKKLKNKVNMNMLIRKGLDQFVIIIKNYVNR